MFTRRVLITFLGAALVSSAAIPGYAEQAAGRAQFRVLDTEHFHISYNSGEVFARKRAELFERLYVELTKFFTAKAFDVKAPAGRMNVLLLATRAEYRAHAPGTARNAEGYYSPDERRAVFFNVLEDPEYVNVSQSIAAVERALRDYRAQLGGNYTAQYKAWVQSRIAAEQNELQALRAHYNRSNESTTLHECAHQLIHSLGIAPTGKGTPHWLHEGLATFFEPALSHDVSQPRTIDYKSLVEFRSAQRRLVLIGLERLITDDRKVLGNPLGYAQAWALVHYLLHEHSARMKRYLDVLKARKTAGSDGARQRLEDFKSVFGDDLAAFEAAWIAYVSQVR